MEETVLNRLTSKKPIETQYNKVTATYESTNFKRLKIVYFM